MRTVSYSLDEDIIQGIEDLARQTKLSRSDVVRSMYVRMRLEKTLENMQAKASPLVDRLGLSSEDDIASYAKSKD